MKKIFSILLSIFCVFSFNLCFDTNHVMAANDEIQQELPELPMDGKVDEDVLNEPIFTPDKDKKPAPNKFAVSVKSIVLYVLGGAALILVIVSCFSFPLILVPKLRQQRDARRKRQGADTNIIDAVDNFARHRIK